MTSSPKEIANMNIEKLEQENRNLKDEIKRLNRVLEGKEDLALTDFIKKIELETYIPAYVYILKPKCNECDENRYINFLSPQGKKMRHECSCNERYHIYQPRKAYLYEFRGIGSTITVYYRFIEGEWGEREYYLSDIEPYNDKPFNELSDNITYFFKDKKTCQEYCDYLNS